MKKILLGTTALVGASLLGAVPVAAGEAAGEAPVLSFSGNTSAELTGVDQDLTAGRGRGYDIDTDGNNMGWSAKGTADNGVTYHVSTVANLTGGTFISDEAKIAFNTTWGTVIVGDDDGADDVMMVGGFSLVTGGYAHDGGYSSLVNRGGLAGTNASPSLVGDTGDASKISYYTPRMSGLQIGVSFTPDGGAANNVGLSALAAGGGADNNGNVENGLGLGMNYIGKAGDIGYKLGVTHGMGTTEPNSVAPGAASSLQREDLDTWSAGATVSFSGFSVGMGYGDNGDSNCTVVNTLCEQSEWWDITGQYKFGSNTVALSYFNNDSNALGSAVADDEVEIMALGFNHVFASAPGLSMHGEVVSWHGDRAGTVNDNDATYVMIGTKVAF